MASETLERLRGELAATVKYAEEIGEKLEDRTLGASMRADYESELEALEEKANGLKSEIKAQERKEARELRIRNIGRESGAIAPDDEPRAAHYRSPVDVLFDNETFRAVLADKSRRNSEWATGALEFVSAVDPADANPDTTLVQHMVPGMVTPYIYPQRVGQLFSQGAMDGDHVSQLFIPDDADGTAGYATYGAQKPGPGTLEVDVTDVKAAKIAASMVVPDDALDDISALRSNIENLLLVGPNGVGVKAEAEYIAGAGTTGPQKLKGVATLSPDDVSGSGENVVEDIIFAALDIENETGQPATAVVCNPTDYFYLITLKADDGRPLFSPFGGAYGPPSGLPPVVRSKAASAGTVYVGAWNLSTLYTRQAIIIKATNQGLGLTDYNQTLFVAETRQALAHWNGKKAYRIVSIGSS